MELDDEAFYKLLRERLPGFYHCGHRTIILGAWLAAEPGTKIEAARAAFDLAGLDSDDRYTVNRLLDELLGDAG